MLYICKKKKKPSWQHDMFLNFFSNFAWCERKVKDIRCKGNSWLVAVIGRVYEIYFPCSMPVINNEYDMIQTHLMIRGKIYSTLSLRPYYVNNDYTTLKWFSILHWEENSFVRSLSLIFKYQFTGIILIIN